MRVYDARDVNCTGLGLGAVFPAEDSAEVQEDAGGEYVLRMTVPVAQDTGWELLEIDRQITAPCPVWGEIKLQRFRIHALTLADNGGEISVQARHISYDLQYVVAGPVAETEDKITVQQAVDKLWTSIDGEPPGITVDVTTDAVLRIGWGKISVTRALLDSSGGLVRMARARLIRDNTVIHLAPSEDPGGDAVIRHGVDLLGLSLDADATETYTRLMPTGQDEKGDIVYLPERFIDSPRINAYAKPRIYTWQVAGAKIGTKKTLDDGTTGKLTLEDVYGLLREAAQEKLDGGCDLPASNGSVEYIDLGRTNQCPELAWLQDVRLYETVSVKYPALGIVIGKPVRGYLWDPIALRYTQLRLGDPFQDAGKDSYVTSSQRASDGKAGVANMTYIHTKLEDSDSFIRDQISYNNSVLVQLDAVDGTILALSQSVQTDLETQEKSINRIMLEMDSMENELTAKVTQTNDGVNANAQALAELQATVEKARVELEATITGNSEALAQLEADLDSATATLQASITKNEGAISKNSTALAQLETDLDSATATLQASIARNEGSISNNSTALAQLEADLDSATATLQASIGENTASISATANDLRGKINLIADEVSIKADRTEITGLASIAELEAAVARINELDAELADIEIGFAEMIVTETLGVNGSATVDTLRVVGNASVNGTAIVNALEIGGEPGATQTWVNEESQAARAIETIEATGGVLKIVLYDGTTVNFNKASVAALKQTWSGGRLVISTATSGITLSGDTTASVNSTPANLTWVDNVATFDVTSDKGTIIAGMKVNASSVYANGSAAGAAGVTLTDSGWVGGVSTVTASNGKSESISLPPFSVSGGDSWNNNKTTVYFSTASVSGALKSIEVDAGSVYDAGYAAGLAYARENVVISASKALAITKIATNYYQADITVDASVDGTWAKSRAFSTTKQFT